MKRRFSSAQNWKAHHGSQRSRYTHQHGRPLRGGEDLRVLLDASQPPDDLRNTLRRSRRGADSMEEDNDQMSLNHQDDIDPRPHTTNIPEYRIPPDQRNAVNAFEYHEEFFTEEDVGYDLNEHSTSQDIRQPLTKIPRLDIYINFMDKLENLCSHCPHQVLPFLLMHKDDLFSTLQKKYLSNTEVYSLIKSLRIAIENSKSSIQIEALLDAMRQTSFLVGALVSFIAVMEEFAPGEQLSAVLSNVIMLLLHLVEPLKDQIRSRLCVPVDFLHTKLARMQSLDVSFSWMTKKLFQDLKNKIDRGFPSQPEFSLGLTSTRQSADFREIPVFPTPEDIFGFIRPRLKPNIVRGNYSSSSAYLDTHFCLLREDFMRPLRNGIMSSLSPTSCLSHSQRNKGDVKPYKNVRVLVPGVMDSGVIYKVQLDTSSLSPSFWMTSKKLMYGSLVCLIAENCDEVLFATVANRDPAKLRKGIISLDIKKNHRAISSVVFKVQFTMVESPAFFEAYRHVLEGLQEMATESVPFERYFVDCNTDVLPPVYLRGDDVTMDLSVLCPPQSRAAEEALLDLEDEDSVLDTKDLVVNPFKPETWTQERFPWLDESQIEAIHLALTRELALIQGPPGTGKTFLGLQLVKVLLDNAHRWDQLNFTRPRSPILVVCYTNHALDQFLEGIHDFLKEGIVRIGGRSKSQVLENFTLKNIRKKQLQFILTQEQRRLFSRTMKDLKEFERQISEKTGVLNLLSKGILSERELPEFLEKCPVCMKHYSALILSWLKISPKQNQGNSDRQQKTQEMDEDFFMYGNNDRDLDDNDCYHPTEKPENSAQLKFAYLCTDDSGHDRFIINRINDLDIMSDAEQRRVCDIWRLNLKDRWRLYRAWKLCYEGQLKSSLTECLVQYEKATEEMGNLKLRENLSILQNAKVIGMTTTGAAKFRRLLQNIKPRTVIVEEAAEILEAHVLTTLTSSCQHLILIGDHLQLRPKPADYELEKKYKLGISLFERMINNDISYVQLVCQHRMRPEISQILVPLFYESLQDYKSVYQYEHVKGVDTSVFFINHSEAEDRESDLHSPSNSFEANFLVSFCKYLLKQGYSGQQVTILTPYTEQLFKLRKLMKGEELQDVQVKVIDDFQGEENDIILLSLVRGNKEGSVGFLKEKNRICVAFSRAKRGFYCLANFDTLAGHPDATFWKDILLSLEDKKLIGRGLTLICQRHPGTKTVIQKGSDFRRIPEGGCTLPCQDRLPCGHPCQRKCHPNDLQHTAYRCKLPCERSPCTKGHPCPKTCWEDCGLCEVEVDKELSGCGHVQRSLCYVPDFTIVCKHPTVLTLPCGHNKEVFCSEDLAKVHCQELVDLELPCGHTKNTECFYRKMPPPCFNECSETLDCGHACSGNCDECIQGNLHVGCKKKCTRILVCSHTCQGPCVKACPPCRRRCGNGCSHSQCNKKCGEVCYPCTLPCTWACEHHKCTKPCGEECDRPRCNEPCGKILECSHPCMGLCGEECPWKCRLCNKADLTEIFFGTEEAPDARFVVLSDCSHIFEVTGMDHYMDSESDEQQLVQLKVCPRCRVPILRNSRYNNVIKKTWDSINKVKRKFLGTDSEILALKKETLQAAETVKHSSEMWEVHIVQKIMDANSLQALNALRNTVNFFASLSHLQMQANRCTADRKSSLYKMLAKVRRWLSHGRSTYTPQQLQELRNEITRIALLADIFDRLSYQEIHNRQLPEEALEPVNHILEVLKSKTPFKEENEKAIEEDLAKVKGLISASPLQITEQERLEIVKAIDLKVGHWYQCPQGHVYVIGECGRPMQTSNCPECGVQIGGQDHRLTEDNVEAPFMLEPLDSDV
ncbi:NFX1-type zinc finger-containing protein 1 isoform X2 [Amia ocellicauda]|uniref:NFX1-type zinc finger-containing protein 1 isoform X2 n=1 Tax=Amia ocellicauda TaxID=2972642 RepID=UPI003463E5D3